jgi:M6 family metalloprotease-like protein
MPAPNEPAVLGYYFGAVDKYFQRVDSATKKPVSSASPIIGCYISNFVNENFESAKWDVGIISRDSIGYYWRNAAGRFWRLTPEFATNKFVTGADNPYFALGKNFELSVPFDAKNPTTCRIMSFGRFSPGFSRDEYLTYGKSEINVKVIIPELIDDPVKINRQETVDALNLAKVAEFYTSQSYGKVSLKFSMQDRTFKIPGKASDYVDEATSGERKVFQLMKAAYNEFLKVNPKRDYEFLIFALPKEYKNPHAGFATDLSSITDSYWEDRKIRITWMGSAPHFWGDPGAPPWKVVAHEIGHNFGLSDLYATTTNYENINNYSGKTIGPFDMMGSISAAGNELTFWNRWLLGWIQDSQVTCLPDPKGPTTINLNPIADQSGGPKGIVIPTSSSTAYFIESRRAQGFDSALKSNEVGLVVYALDTKIGSGAGPIKVIPKQNQYSQEPYSQLLSDTARFIKAPLQPGDSLVIDGIRIINVGDESRDKALILVGDDPRPVPTLTVTIEKSYTINVKEVVPVISSTSSAAFEIKSSTIETCAISGSRILLLKIGICTFSVSQGMNGTHLAAPTQEFSFVILEDPQIEISRLQAQEQGTYLVAPDCHATVMNGEVQIKDAQGNWSFYAPTIGKIPSPSGCPLTNPSTMWTAITAPQNSVLRWRFWYLAWEGFSAEITWINPVIKAKEEASQPPAKPVVTITKKTISCIKGKKTIKVTALKPKCPAGYKVKK